MAIDKRMIEAFENEPALVPASYSNLPYLPDLKKHWCFLYCKPSCFQNEDLNISSSSAFAVDKQAENEAKNRLEHQLLKAAEEKFNEIRFRPVIVQKDLNILEELFSRYYSAVI